MAKASMLESSKGVKLGEITTNDAKVAGETLKRVRDWDVKTRVMSTISATKQNKNGRAWVCEWNFDFAGVSEEQLVELATRSLIIEQQRVFRASSAPDKDRIATIDVLEMLEKERGPVDKVQRARGALRKLSKEEILALLAEQGIEAEVADQE